MTPTSHRFTALELARDAYTFVLGALYIAGDHHLFQLISGAYTGQDKAYNALNAIMAAGNPASKADTTAYWFIRGLLLMEATEFEQAVHYLRDSKVLARGLLREHLKDFTLPPQI